MRWMLLPLGMWLLASVPDLPRREALTPAEVLARPDQFLGKTIAVTGRIHMEKYENLQPCGADSPGGCSGVTRTTLHVVTPGERRRTGQSLDLYRATPDGGEEPLGCRVVSAKDFDCGTLTPDSIAVVSGRLVKHRVPLQQVGYPDGRMVVLRYEEVLVLVVEPARNAAGASRAPAA